MLGLETTGRKAELIERLKEALEEEEGDTAPKPKKVKKEPEQTEFQKAKEILQEQDGKYTVVFAYSKSHFARSLLANRRTYY